MFWMEIPLSVKSINTMQLNQVNEGQTNAACHAFVKFNSPNFSALR